MAFTWNVGAHPQAHDQKAREEEPEPALAR